MSETVSPSSRRWRAGAAALVVAALPLLGCTPTTNDPDAYGPVTEANVLDGCIRSGMEDPGDTRVVVVDDGGDDDDANDEVVYTQDVPSDERDACQCLYDGIVEEIPFADFEKLDDDFTEVADSEESDTTVTTVRAQTTVAEIAAGCDFPSS